MIWSRISDGSVYCDFLRGFEFEIRYLYLLYSHMISVVKGCLGGSPIFSGYMEPDGSKHNLAGEWALVIFQFCKISRPDFI
jgi:hypothetical protein